MKLGIADVIKLGTISTEARVVRAIKMMLETSIIGVCENNFRYCTRQALV